MKTFRMLTLTGLIAAAPALALANVQLGDNLGTSEAEVRSALEAQGYQILSFEAQNGEFEVELSKDGVETELVLNETDGVVTTIETEAGKD